MSCPVKTTSYSHNCVRNPEYCVTPLNPGQRLLLSQGRSVVTSFPLTFTSVWNGSKEGETQCQRKTRLVSDSDFLPTRLS